MSEPIFYFKDKSRNIVPFEGQDIQSKARQRLNFLRENYKLPDYIVENWEKVKLYNPGGEVNKATALIIEIEDGAYDVKNKMNDLTGKQWTKFTCSWFIFNALRSDIKEEIEVSPDTQNHPATYSPTMISSFIEFFTKKGDVVFDPFLGIGSTLVACNRTGRIGYGIELNPEYYELAKLRNKSFSENIFNTDSTKLDKIKLPEIDFSISSPPYWDVLNRSTDGFKAEREEKGLHHNYSDSVSDLGNIGDYDEFIKKTCLVYKKLYKKMKNHGYLVIIVKNVKKKGKLYPIAWDLARELGKLYTLKDEKIWIQDKIGLSPYGYPHSWASNILHHYCLVFQKEEG